ncbi:MAG TPA: hypothetical protein VJ820_14965, partial [Propionibacteriaceae bacterium]|nr:hypothetical protein [Propionibacteriaceae bacterium]
GELDRTLTPRGARFGSLAPWRLHIARRSGSHSGIIQQADHPHSGQTIGCYGKPALGGKD